MTRSLVAVIVAFALPVAAVADSCKSLFEELHQTYKRADKAPNASTTIRRAKLREVESMLFGALAQCPRDAALFALMGEVQISLGQAPLAAVYGRKAIEFDPTSWRAQQLIGSSLVITGNPREGIQHLERARELAPDNAAVRVNLASALAIGGDYPRALALCETLIESKDQGIAAAAHNIRGQVYARQGDLKAAAREFNTAERLGFDPGRSVINHETSWYPAQSGNGPVR